MSVEEQVRRVLSDLAPDSASQPFTIESRPDGAALLPLDGPYQTFTGALQSWAGRMTDAGFLVAMVRDSEGAYLQVS